MYLLYVCICENLLCKFAFQQLLLAASCLAALQNRPATVSCTTAYLYACMYVYKYVHMYVWMYKQES